ncbi:hypothetical protein HYH02_005341 [Chlamydomonas schloesseri]|uniref:Uncharacterized protein n=1 Tax=Chlamydomonas schloesseri TaxID=2026947 RepID=A0A835WLA5_9CHLO|nr:hypothetical protein HYH02_005341 [Chlamydomonas schloesseri]|eukprot:KAG2449818.1 hypothetical protein HYH02_005341 [Chlamydomonas schloesseri]
MNGGCWRRRHPSAAAAWRSLPSAAAGSAATTASARRAALWRLLAASPPFGCRSLAQPPFGCCGQRSHHGVCSPRCLMYGGCWRRRHPSSAAAYACLLILRRLSNWLDIY